MKRSVESVWPIVIGAVVSALFGVGLVALLARELIKGRIGEHAMSYALPVLYAMATIVAGVVCRFACRGKYRFLTLVSPVLLLLLTMAVQAVICKEGIMVSKHSGIGWLLGMVCLGTGVLRKRKVTRMYKRVRC